MYKIITGRQAVSVHNNYIVQCTSKLLPVSIKSEMFSINKSSINPNMT